MRLWQRRAIGVLTLGGGFLGTTLAIASLASADNLFSKIILIGFSAIFAWGAWCGLKFLEGRGGSFTQIRVYWLLQIPYFTTPIISFHLFSGTWVLLGLQTASPHFLWALQFGDHFSGQFMRPTPFGIGINVIAILIFWFLSHVDAKTSLTKRSIHGNSVSQTA